MISRWARRLIFDPLQALPVVIIYYVLKTLPIDLASGSMGALARFVGPYLKVSELGRKNLSLAFPKKTPQERELILKGVWENLGRVVGEFPHMDTIGTSSTRVEIVNGDLIAKLRDDGHPGIFIAAHLANWELPHLTVTDHGLAIALISRPPNNWILRWFLDYVRRNALVHLILKGSAGSKELLKLLQQGGHVGILVDQRLSEGELIPFFGKDAFTAVGPSKLAAKYKAPLVPVQVERLKGAHFRVTFHKPVELKETPEKTTEALNKIIEKWIIKHPEQWLWLHNRWKL
jgi:KDO2-lipid IV(A) lauroyltransferase